MGESVTLRAQRRQAEQKEATGNPPKLFVEIDGRTWIGRSNRKILLWSSNARKFCPVGGVRHKEGKKEVMNLSKK